MDGYKDNLKRGRELNEDQRSAIEKYDELMQTLDLVRELHSQFKALSNDEDKAKKRNSKKELQQRSKDDLRKVASVLEAQDVFKGLMSKSCVKDLING